MKDDKLQEIIELLPYSTRYSGEIEELLDYAKEQAERVQELEDIIYKDERQAVLESMYEENKRYKQALEQVWEMTKESIMDGRIYIVVDKALKGESE